MLSLTVGKLPTLLETPIKYYFNISAPDLSGGKLATAMPYLTSFIYKGSAGILIIPIFNGLMARSLNVSAMKQEPIRLNQIISD
jgi:hypothetical protein